MINEEIFHIGETASECETGANSDYPGLCSTDEEFEDSPTPAIKNEGSEVHKHWLMANGGGGSKHVHVHNHKPSGHFHVHTTHYRVHYH